MVAPVCVDRQDDHCSNASLCDHVHPHSPLSALCRVLCRSFQQVRHAFIEYSEYMKVEVDRVRANIQKLQPHQKAALPEEFWQLHER